VPSCLPFTFLSCSIPTRIYVADGIKERENERAKWQWSRHSIWARLHIIHASAVFIGWNWNDELTWLVLLLQLSSPFYNLYYAWRWDELWVYSSSFFQSISEGEGKQSKITFSYIISLPINILILIIIIIINSTLCATLSHTTYIYVLLDLPFTHSLTLFLILIHFSFIPNVSFLFYLETAYFQQFRVLHAEHYTTFHMHTHSQSPKLVFFLFLMDIFMPLHFLKLWHGMAEQGWSNNGKKVEKRRRMTVGRWNGILEWSTKERLSTTAAALFLLQLVEYGKKESWLLEIIYTFTYTTIITAGRYETSMLRLCSALTAAYFPFILFCLLHSLFYFTAFFENLYISTTFHTFCCTYIIHNKQLTTHNTLLYFTLLHFNI